MLAVFAMIIALPWLNVVYGLTYLAMFAEPLFGLRRAPVRPPWWVKLCAVSGLLMITLYVTLSVLPIIPVGSRILFALKIVGLIVATRRAHS